MGRRSQFRQDCAAAAYWGRTQALQGVMTSALERDSVFRSCLSEDEFASFRAALRKLEIVALALAESTPKPRNI
jgi:hypothetical protein